jgi:murein DD-endopeptidase MepM/ murein hydrolase activator NlpD
MAKLAAFVFGFLAGGVSTIAILARPFWSGQAGAAVPPAPAAVAAAPSATPSPALPQTPTPPSLVVEPAPPLAPDLAATPAPASPKPPSLDLDLDRLRRRELRFPIDGLDLGLLRDTFAESRDGRRHEAIDIMAPRGTPVLAVDDGPVKKLFTSVRGGLTVYQFDAAGEYCYYYAHLDRYAPGLAEGVVLKKGDRVGDVGATGNAPPHAPHLHLAIFRLGPEKRWWQGTPVNAYPLWARPGQLPAPEQGQH